MTDTERLDFLIAHRITVFAPWKMERTWLLRRYEKNQTFDTTDTDLRKAIDKAKESVG